MPRRKEDRLTVMPLNVSDFLGSASVQQMSGKAARCYLWLLVCQWNLAGKGLPNDVHSLSKMCRYKGRGWTSIWRELSACFSERDGRLFNERLHEEWVESQERKRIASTRGRAGADARWNAQAMLGDGSPSPTPSSKKKKEEEECSELKNSSEPAIPPELIGLHLYETEETLLRRWPELLKSWHEACPAVDIASEIRKAHAWEVSNPKRRKRDKAKFLFSWLSRAQDDTKVGPSARSPQRRNTGVSRRSSFADEQEGKFDGID